MFKLLFLLVLNLVAAMLNDNNGSQSQTNTTGGETAVPPATGIIIGRTLYLFSISDMNLSDGNQSNQSQFIPGANQLVICQTVVQVVDPRDNNCRCATHTARRDVKFCNTQVMPTVQQLTEKDKVSNELRDVSCGPKDKEGIMFSFGYQACHINAHLSTMPIPLPLPEQENPDFFEVYKFCYSKKDKEVIYTEHMIHNPEVLTGEPLRIQQRQDRKYNMMANGYELFGSQFENIKDAYLRLKMVYAEKIFDATYNPESAAPLPEDFFTSMVKAQQLVPVDDMAFTLTRRPTYHFLNIAAMKQEQIFLWNYMSHLIREDARKRDKLFTINTGAYIINPRKKKEAEEAKEAKDVKEEAKEVVIEEADIWIKMVRYKKPTETFEETGQMESFAIVMNTGLDEIKFKEFNDELCGNNLCENAFATYKIFEKTHHSISCCTTKKIAKKFFDENFGTESVLEIKAFTEVEQMPLEEEKKYMGEILNFFPTLM